MGSGWEAKAKAEAKARATAKARAAGLGCWYLYRKELLGASRSTSGGGKSGNSSQAIEGVGVAVGVSFRKLGCGIEGKWRSGFWGVSWVPGFSLFQQEGGFGLWIPGYWAWICGFEGDLAWAWRGGVLHRQRVSGSAG